MPSWSPTNVERALAAWPVPPLDEGAMQRARAHQAQLTKPAGSLGRLERLAVQLAGIQGTDHPRVAERAVVVMAGDHGVVQEGVSAYPAEVTAQMVANFAAGGAAINVLARQAGARVVVVDVGVATALPPDLPIQHRKVRLGTANLAQGPAMSREEALAAIGVGMQVLEQEYTRGLQLVCLGEMGIGNTTAASALAACLTGLSAEQVTGRGTGIDDATWQRKVQVVRQAAQRSGTLQQDGLGALAAVGGLEIAALAGVTLAAAAKRVVIVVDGFIATAAVLAAVALCPAVRGYLVAAHRSAESGHRALLEHLEIEPLLQLDMRLGEGSGAALVLPIIDAALALHAEMATFASAGISQADPPAVTRDARAGLPRLTPEQTHPAAS